MGQSQSKLPEQAITDKLAERLRAMQLEHEKDYLMVERDSGMSFGHGIAALTATRETISGPFGGCLRHSN
jgi:hypothetical protein